MKRRRLCLLFVPIAVVLGVVVAGRVSVGHEAAVAAAELLGRPPKIEPDYVDTVIPPNIAPLNFIVGEPGARYFVRIYSVRGRPISIHSRGPRIVISPASWRRLLAANHGQPLYLDICVADSRGRWARYKSITNTIAAEDIDSFLVYRLTKPIYNFWQDTDIYLRDLRSYRQSPVLRGRSFHYGPSGGCVNCHAFCPGRADRMVIGLRDAAYGTCTLLATGRKATKINTKFSYTAWHPSGRLILYSVNEVRQFFHAVGAEVRDVIDLDSALCYYLIDSQTIKTHPKLAQKDRLETYPAWSPDGKYLYFCSAPILWENRNQTPPENYHQLRYDLMRISYDIQTDTWGELETVLSAQQTGKSILLPRISPDGRFLVFCMCDYGCFPIYQPSSDLYIIDLDQAESTGKFTYRAIENINSKRCESWHCWSSNSRWLVFSSKCRDGVFTRSYFTYIDRQGQAGKPFVLPQKDPDFYESFLKTYSVPELVAGPPLITEKELVRAIRSTERIEVTMPLTAATPGVGIEPWQQRE
jgi:hypothetical protein